MLLTAANFALVGFRFRFDNYWAIQNHIQEQRFAKLYSQRFTTAIPVREHWHLNIATAP